MSHLWDYPQAHVSSSSPESMRVCHFAANCDHNCRQNCIEEARSCHLSAYGHVALMGKAKGEKSTRNGCRNLDEGASEVIAEPY